MGIPRAGVARLPEILVFLRIGFDLLGDLVAHRLTAHHEFVEGAGQLHDGERHLAVEDIGDQDVDLVAGQQPLRRGDPDLGSALAVLEKRTDAHALVADRTPPFGIHLVDRQLRALRIARPEFADGPVNGPANPILMS